MEAREYMAGAFLDLAAAKVKDGNKEEAIQYLAKAIQSKPCKAELYNRIGVVLLEVDEFGQAIEILQESLRIESECAEAHNNLAVAYYREGRLNEAVEHCREALRLKPDLAEARDNLNKLEKRRKVSK
jgi:Flp pilus assembly protein TadD